MFAPGDFGDIEQIYRAFLQRRCDDEGKVEDLFQKVKGILIQHGCQSVLQHHVIPSGLRLIGTNFTVQQDDDPKHSSEV